MSVGDLTVQYATNVAVVLLILVAGYTDCRKRLIENRLTLPAIAIGFLLNLAGHGWQGILLSFMGLSVGAGLFLLPFLFGRLGAGDVKLMGAIGAILGSYSALNVALYAAIAGGILAIVISALNKDLPSTINRVGRLIGGRLRTKSSKEAPILDQSEEMIPYGLAIGAGTMCFLLAGPIV